MCSWKRTPSRPNGVYSWLRNANIGAPFDMIAGPLVQCRDTRIVAPVNGPCASDAPTAEY